ncbi:hypothetical protein CHU92_04705 [Flavobacterium cyanobacteriorum]|uniref:TonB C-terminal domain-containing protein n=1 Tax=Flavobacterium cyanobacteriorum TaxID=2022802 RepID=A0A255ZDJ0_9FLAO|nr:energy transducer TonB [Flavobacterium cyanobacteriorum]OYQ39546.1 hypothetical protein CHU92_04705 [Flavobacterium cyanobacteriorum]
MKKIILLLLFLFSSICFSQEREAEETVYEASEVTVQPEYTGGQNQFFSYIHKNLKVPVNAAKGTHKIIVSFIVEKDGSMSEITIVKDPGFGLGRETLRLFNTIPEKWEPGYLDNKPVRVKYNVPITVNIK